MNIPYTDNNGIKKIHTKAFTEHDLTFAFNAVNLGLDLEENYDDKTRGPLIGSYGPSDNTRDTSRIIRMK